LPPEAVEAGLAGSLKPQEWRGIGASAACANGRVPAWPSL